MSRVKTMCEEGKQQVLVCAGWVVNGRRADNDSPSLTS